MHNKPEEKIMKSIKKLVFASIMLEAGGVEISHSYAIEEA
jgi:hypothetical protein